MTKKQTTTNMSDISVKSTKEQILSAYNDVLTKLADTEVVSPQAQQKHQEEQMVLAKSTTYTPDTILSDLSNLKSKAIKQLDNLSEQLLSEFQKLSNLRNSIEYEQNHLKELYQINETANTLSALLQTQNQQKEKFTLEIEQTKSAFETDMEEKKSFFQKQHVSLEQEYKELKQNLEKTRKREEEEYAYTLDSNRRKELDEYNNNKLSEEKTLAALKESLTKREEELLLKEQDYASLKAQVEQIPNIIASNVAKAEEHLSSIMTKEYDFTTKLKQQEYESTLQLNLQKIDHLEDKLKKQDLLIKELTDRADQATKQIQSIACRALDTSARRFLDTSQSNNSNNDKEKI